MGKSRLRVALRLAWRLRRPGRAPSARPRQLGQSITEFAVIAPLLITVTGAAIDFARVFQANQVLASATRNAAEYAATRSTSGTATADAATILCAETRGLPGYVSSVSAPFCTKPTVAVTYTASSSLPGGSTAYPVASVTVTATLPFRALFPYPLFTQNGDWTLTSTQHYSVIRGR